MLNIYKKIPLMLRLLLAILLGVLFGKIFPENVVRIFVTFSSIFSSFLGFCIPLIIVGFIIPGISQIEKNAGKLLGISTISAYVSTILIGFLAFFTSRSIFPYILGGKVIEKMTNPEDLLLKGFVELKLTPVFDVMTALVISFIIGIGLTAIKSDVLKKGFDEFGNIIEILLSKMIIPILPVYILGVFMNMTASGEVFKILKIFLLVFVLIVLMQWITLFIHYIVAGKLSKENPVSMIKKMLPAYMAAIGTQSSAATIPVTLQSTKNIGVNSYVANFTVPLFATIHLLGSTITLVTCSTAVYWLQSGGVFPSTGLMIKFILLLGVTMVAAPGVPGGAVMTALGLLSASLGFNEIMLSLMIALYIAQDSFGTACNVTGDGSLSVIIEKIYNKYLK